MLFKRKSTVVFSRSYQLLLAVAIAVGAVLLTQCENEKKVLEPLEDNWESAIKYQHIPDGLNSLSVLKLVTLIEAKCDLEIDDEDLTVENMSSIETIIRMVTNYVKE